jgi:phosphoglycolate phosphatase
MLKTYDHIFWDWNGTMLDDAWLCVEVMNTMLSERTLPLLTLDKYRHIFDFPVKDYYQKLGFDFQMEPFEEVGMEFMVRYNERQKECELHGDVTGILEHCRARGYLQYILSAREVNELHEEILQLGVISFFEKICGTNDHYAHGKTEAGRHLISSIHTGRNRVLFIGDTAHDAEVARDMGVDCILIPNGHHHEHRLTKFGFRIIPSLSDLKLVL